MVESVGDGQLGVAGTATVATLTDAGQYQPPADSDLAVIARSTGRGTSTERIDQIPLFELGTYYLAVTGYDGASSGRSYALQLDTDTPTLPAPVCPVGGVTFPFPGAGVDASVDVPVGTNTLFVINNRRFGDQYGADAAADVLDAIESLGDELGQGELADLQLVAGIVDLGSIPAVSDAYDEWDDAPCMLDLADDVVDATTAALAEVYSDNPGIENVVMVGSDKIIPFARLSDRTLLGNEQNYALTFAEDRSTALYAALSGGTYFSDDPYADMTPTLVNDRLLHAPERAIGRLVEDPQSIIGQLTSFVALDGKIRTDTGLVTGYDFVSDSSSQISDRLSADTTDGFQGPVTSAPIELISETWNAADLGNVLFPSGAEATGIGAVNGHFSHQGTQSALGSANGDQTDALFIDDVGDTDFTGSLIFTLGCHSGLSVGEDVSAVLAADWAEAFSRAGAGAYIAQSGFGYGSSDSVQLTEALLVDFSERLDGNATIGDALRLAKNSYLARVGAGSISVYDEKSAQQAILFGLPFSTPDVASPPPPPVAPPALELTAIDVAGDLLAGTVDVDVEIDRREVAGRGTVFEIDGRASAPAGYPLQPITTIDATGPDANNDGVPDDRLHGALLRSGSAYTEGTIDPVYQTPTITGSESEPELQPLDAVFPISPLAVSAADTEFGPRDFVVAQPGRFTATQPDGTGTQVLYDDLTVQTLHSNSDDWVAPTIDTVTQSVTGGALSVAVSTPSIDVAGVVVAVVENLTEATSTAPTVWHTFDLQAAADGRWSGGILLAACSEELQYLVQIYDTAGNVRVMSNKAAGFISSCTDDPPPPPNEDLVAEPEEAPSTSGWFEGDVTIVVTSSLPGPLSYRVDGGPQTPLIGGEFTISGPGVHTYSVTAPGGSTTTTVVVSGTVLIDDGDPTATIASPAVGDVYSDSEVRVVFSCADVSPTSCTGQLTLPNGSVVPVDSGDTIVPTVGSTTLTVTAIDALGNETTATRTFRTFDRPLVFEGFFSPLAPDDPSDPQVLNVVKAAQAVPLKWRIYKADGTLVTSTAGITVRHRFVGCDSSAAQDEVDATEAPTVGGGLKFIDGQFQFTLKTQKSWSKKCGVVTVTYGDLDTHGQLQTAEVLFRYR